MSITLETIKKDVLEARKSRDSIKANVLNTLIAEVCRDTKEPSEENVQRVIKKFLKNLNQAISHSGNQDHKLIREYEIVSVYAETTVENQVNFHDIIAQLFADNPDKLLNEKTLGWYTGQVMKITSGKANPDDVKQYLKNEIIRNALVA